MKRLTDEELQQTDGGFSLWAGCAIAAVIILVAGIIDGFTRPLRCHE